MLRYTRTAMWLHWLMAVLIVATFALGVTMVNIPGLTPAKLKYVAIHKWLGVTVFLLACLRLLWRLFHAAPALPANVPMWQQKAAQVLHTALYVLIFVVPLSGYLYSLAAGVPVVYLGLFPLPAILESNQALKPMLRGMHFWLNASLIACVTIHVLAALKHRLIDHDDVLQRMLP